MNRFPACAARHRDDRTRDLGDVDLRDIAARRGLRADRDQRRRRHGRGHRLRPQRRTAAYRPGSQRGLRGRRRPAGTPPAACGGIAGGRTRDGGGSTLGQRQGEPVFPARLQPGPRHRLHHLYRRRTVEPALPWPRPGVPGCQRVAAGDRRPHRLPQGSVPGRRRGFLHGGRLVHSHHRPPGFQFSLAGIR